jgi:ferredoxin-NADP reductase
MKNHIINVESVNKITHDVLKIICNKPPDFTFNPGQATEIVINKVGWENKKRPFSITSLPSDSFLEFTIKIYPKHKGLTNELILLDVNDKLILNDAFGAIKYQGEGVFIAGGAGVTPFISILRDLKSKNEIGNNKLIFANKTKQDIINADEFKSLLGSNFINILSEEKSSHFAYGKISERFLKNHLNNSYKNIYLCGPPAMMEDVETQIKKSYNNMFTIVKETI